MKNWNLLLIAALALSSTLWFSCQKEDLNLDGPLVRVTFAGQVADENGQPLSGAEVCAGTVSTTTDQNGMFRLKNIQMPSRNAILHVRQAGYFDFSRAYIVQNGAIQSASIQLLRKQLVHSFMANQSTIAAAGNVRLSFPANSVVKADGSAYSGIVSVYARHLDPDNSDLYRQMPGDLRGVSAGGEEQTLATFGMVGVELTTPGGEALQIAPGKEVELSMPIPTDKLAVAPAVIPLWHYDQDKARWIEEGSAQKSGNNYVGKVKHFSFWNCDVGIPLIHLDGKVFLGNAETPLGLGNWIKLTILSNGWEGFGGADMSGHFGGAVPLGEAMKLEVFVLDQCGQPVSVYSQNIGPFANNTTLPDIIAPISSNIPSLQISGRLVDCNQKPLSSGYVRIDKAPYNPQFVLPDNNGTFSATVFICDNIPFEVQAFDPDNLKTSLPVNVSNFTAPAQLGDIPVCTTPTEFVEINLGNQKYNFLSGFEAFVNGTGTTIYGWQDQSNVGFRFQNNGQTGTFPLESFSLYPQVDTLFNINITTNLTFFGAAGQSIIGTLNGTVTDKNGQTKIVTGKYQVIRDN